MIGLIADLGSGFLGKLVRIGQAWLMLMQAIIVQPKASSLSRLIQQLYVVGVQSLIIILVSALFIGMVLGLQGYTLLAAYGTEQAVGQMVALTLVRELSPVVAALLFAGRAGSALTAEIGLMKATEQLASLEMFGVDPLHRIVAPRFWAGIISLPLLVAIFSLVGIYGGHLVAVDWLGVYSGSYWGNMQQAVDFNGDVLNGMVKALVFAFLISWTAVYQGYTCVPTSQGISAATTRTVVYSSLAILGFDFILTALMFGGTV
ncbi:lipid asymmetry maintenance ABC transporter permease subunit MlaE [Candidatus Njordibacter sp. Uisw_056]|jgi:phospholipid/cholesterol/gamma-HCH transport system permease protein|uniref:lipid asymmetry maintenance ABC transporter permease subunit MlaE n=1 Tax=Candidatus Njordibacter sp. Uisw_056 TaxID=3230973 RepID=UPI003D376ABC|tara:strand:+ start:4054 stop:4836 length:783 start_codon:yes stop_codon:yes gene_type:complete